MKKASVRIGKRILGVGMPALIIAEMSGNHNQSIERAKQIIDAAAGAGADAVKFQTYTADTLTINSTAEPFMVTWKGVRRSLYDLYSEAYTPWEWHAELFEYARGRGLIVFSTPFDPTAVAFLEKLKVPVHKVASFELIDIPLLEAIGKTRKPVIISRGMATLDEMRLALRTLKKWGTKDIIMLQCVSAYPADPVEMHLTNIPDIKKRFKVLTGLSDHTLTNDCAIVAAALGAVVIEKHFTLRRADGGPDSAFSLEPHEFAALVKSVRIVESALGKPSYAKSKGEPENIVFRKSLFVVQDIKKGETFTEANVRSIRPGNGLAPLNYRKILGKRARVDIKRATPLSWKHVAR